MNWGLLKWKGKEGGESQSLFWSIWYVILFSLNMDTSLKVWQSITQ